MGIKNKFLKHCCKNFQASCVNNKMVIRPKYTATQPIGFPSSRLKGLGQLYIKGRLFQKGDAATSFDELDCVMPKYIC